MVIKCELTEPAVHKTVKLTISWHHWSPRSILCFTALLCKTQLLLNLAQRAFCNGLFPGPRTLMRVLVSTLTSALPVSCSLKGLLPGRVLGRQLLLLPGLWAWPVGGGVPAQGSQLQVLAYTVKHCTYPSLTERHPAKSPTGMRPVDQLLSTDPSTFLEEPP